MPNGQENVLFEQYRPKSPWLKIIVFILIVILIIYGIFWLIDLII